MRLIFTLGFLFLTGCSFDWIFFWEDDEPVSAQEGQLGEGKANNAEAGKNTEVREDADEAGKTNLTLTRLIAKVNDLENQLRRQREDFHVLRKGLMTGLIPSEWQDDLPKYSASFGEGERGDRGKSEALSIILGEGEGGGKGFTGLSDSERRRYEEKLARASHHFRSGDYGKAILAYTEIGRDYSDRVTKGSHLLWIGASWFRLKDYQAAKKHLNDLVNKYKTSPWVPEARFILAKTSFREGFIERSLDALKKIINDYPNESVALRAKEELRKVEENL